MKRGGDGRGARVGSGMGALRRAAGRRQPAKSRGRGDDHRAHATPHSPADSPSHPPDPRVPRSSHPSVLLKRLHGPNWRSAAASELRPVPVSPGQITIGRALTSSDFAHFFHIEIPATGPSAQRAGSGTSLKGITGRGGHTLGAAGAGEGEAIPLAARTR